MVLIFEQGDQQKHYKITTVYKGFVFQNEVSENKTMMKISTMEAKLDATAKNQNIIHLQQSSDDKTLL